MNKHLSKEALSAYVDGEHERPDEAERHVQQCAECAAAMVAMRKLSTHIQALPAPEVTHGFDARVMRAIEAQPEKRPAWRLGILTPLAFAAGLALVAGLSYLALPASDETPAPVQQVAEEIALPVAPDTVAQDSEMQLALAVENTDQTMTEELFGQRDYSETLFAMNANEKETLLQLLSASLIDEHMM